MLKNISKYYLTKITAQLQKFEDSAPEALEYERLKEHFEPYLRASPSSSTLPSSSHHHLNPITAAASSALARDIPGVSKYNPMSRSRSGRDRGGTKNDIPDYRARVEAGASNGFSSGSGGEADIEFVKRLEVEGEVALLEQRWVNSWSTSLDAKYVTVYSYLSIFPYKILVTSNHYEYRSIRKNQNVVPAAAISSLNRNKKHNPFVSKSSSSPQTTFLRSV